MKYTPGKGLTVSTNDVDVAVSHLLAAIHYFRKSHDLPLEGVEGGKHLASALNIESGDTCEYCILNAARALGIDLGSERPGELDVRKYS